MLETIIGAAAATLTTVCFIPQAVKIVKTRQTKDISFAMYATFSVGIVCWLIYGIMTGQWNIILCNIVTLPLALAVLFMKVRFG